jgi:hypothetical protein
LDTATAAVAAGKEGAIPIVVYTAIGDSPLRIDRLE